MLFFMYKACTFFKKKSSNFSSVFSKPSDYTSVIALTVELQ